MLKSLSTQFIATLFFGPLGLVYSSVAAAVFLSLILAVLYFTELGILAVAVMWVIAIVVGLVLVKLHNDQIRSSGGSLLLGPDEEEGEAVSTAGSWGRGVAVLSMLAVGGYAGYWYSSQAERSSGADSGRVASVNSSQASLTGSADSGNFNSSNQSNTGELDKTESDLAIAKTYPIDGDQFDGSAFPVSGSRSATTVTVLTSDQQAVEPVIIATSSAAEEINGNVYYVDSEMVNLREGPGTNFSILDQVERGDELIEVDRAGSWIRVKATESSAAGWIFSRLVSSQR